MKIVVLEAVGMHVGFLGCYGNDWVATPTLDSLACEGVVFDHHFTDCPDAARLSGARTGVHAFRNRPAADLLDLARGRGWNVQLIAPGKEAAFSRAVLPALDAWRKETPAVLWIDGPILTPPWSLPGDLLSVYFDEPEQAADSTEQMDDVDDEGETDNGGDIDDEDEDPIAPLVEPEEAQTPWPDPAQGRVGPLSLADFRRLRRTYAAVVTYFDAEVDRLCRAIVEGGWADETLLVVTARAGLPLGEHGVIGLAGATLHEEIAHVPLIVRFPKEEYAGRRIAAITQPADVWASLVERAFGTEPQGDGRSFLPLLTGQAAEIRAHAACAWAAGPLAGASLRMPDWALVIPSNLEEPAGLFIKPGDRWEMNDLRLQQFELAEEMESSLNEMLRPDPAG